jgi:large subunit ribosomal protein L4
MVRLPRSHAIDLPKKVRALALRHALSSKAKSNDLIVIDSADGDGKDQGSGSQQFEKLGSEQRALVDRRRRSERELQERCRQHSNVDVLPVQGINVYDILRRQKLVLTKAAVEALEARFK